MGQIQNLDHLQIIASYLEQSQVIGVGDASVQGHHSAHAYIIESTNEQYHVIGQAPVFTDVDDITSNRSEGCTILAMVHLLTAIAKFFGITHASTRLYCDNDEALRYRPMDRATYTTLTKRDIDIKLEVLHLQNNSPITFILSQVSGHEDDNDSFDYDTAPQEVKRNIDMDIKSKEMVAAIKYSQAPTTILLFPAQKITLLLSGIPIVGDINAQLQLHRYGHSLEQRILDSLPTTVGTLHSIHW